MKISKLGLAVNELAAYTLVSVALNVRECRQISAIWLQVTGYRLQHQEVYWLN